MSQWLAHNPMELRWIAVLAAALIAAVWDVRTHRIPNVLTGLTFLGGVIWSTWSGGIHGLGDSLLACLILAAPFVVLFVIDSAGGGAADAKLMGAIGTWLGFHQGLIALAAVLLIGALLSLGYAAVKGQLGAVMSNLTVMAGVLACGLTRHVGLGEVRVAMPESKRMHAVPYGVSILCGVAAAALMTR